MKCYIIDTLIGIFAIDENGNPVSFLNFNNNDDKIIEFFIASERNIIIPEYQNFILELKDSGFDTFLFDCDNLKGVSEELNINCVLDKHSLEFKNFRLNLLNNLKKFGINISIEDLRDKYKKISQALVINRLRDVGTKGDIIIIQVSETLDIIKKSISLLAGRLREWYGIYFPELTDKIVENIIVLARLVSVIGTKENYTVENLKKNFDFKDSLIKKLVLKASESIGANIDIIMIQKFADQILSLDKYREELEEYLSRLMEQTAPNINALIGPLVGAKLIAKAGSLRRLAFMPASRIQLLGAEKALYRFLKTGEKRPKHGLIFQWNWIRSSKPWIRGKISRMVAGKIGLCAKIDYFSGQFIGDTFAKEINEKIKELEKKFPEPTKQKKISKLKTKTSKKRKRK